MRNRRLSIRTMTAACGNGLALLAVVAQLALPWIQGWHDARERSGDDARIAIISSATSEIAAAEHIEAPVGHRAHDSDACPVCRLISQTHSALVVARRYEIGAALVQRAAIAPHQALPETRRTSVAVPRAPPFLLS